MASTYNLFISHSWSYSDTYDKLEELLDTRPYFFFKNYSVPKDDPIHTNGTDKQLYDLPPGTSPLSKLDLGPFEVHSMV